MRVLILLTAMVTSVMAQVPAGIPPYSDARAKAAIGIGGAAGVLAGDGNGRARAATPYVDFVANPAAGLFKWQQAITKVQNGDRDAKVLVIADSTGAGVGSSLTSTFPSYGSWPTRLAAMMSQRVPTAQGLAIPASALSLPTNDNRWAYGGTWVRDSNGFANGSAAKCANPCSGNLVFTPQPVDTYDSFVIYGLCNSGLGTLTITATGGSPVTLNTGACGQGIGSVVATAGSASTTNSVTISGASGDVFVGGVEPFLSTTRKVRIGNAGVPSSRSAQWAVSTPAYKSIGSVLAYAPDLCLIELGINDAGDGVATSSYISSIQTIATACKASGDVAIVLYPPSSGEPRFSNEAAYRMALLGLGYPVVDIWGRWGSVHQASYMTDLLHPNNVGYFDMANAVYALLRLSF